ncbi:MAG: biopolymer transporter ExbB [Isosphaeraceae bacterium]|jgi:biopolymer transport protein ExbB|nr:MAG: biopolymer transporter ExbB [Isosphaeraceae bacterium]
MQAPTRAATGGGGLDVPSIIEQAGVFIYVAIALLGVWGLYNTILLYRTLAKKGIRESEAEALIGRVKELLGRGDVKGAVEACQDPAHWHTALAQMMAMTLRNRSKGLAKVKQLLVMDFHTEVVSGLENRVASLATAARLGPLLGLLGTVMAMIAAFARMGSGGKPDPTALAQSISLGLWTTAAGLLIANPLMMFGNDAQARLRRLRDRTERQLSDFLEIFEQSDPRSRAASARAAATR